ncbi:MAG: metal ABC transporter substrate-binding protein [Synechococcus sp. SB0668_bin_15]|nr:metal ABC transporter substrate-binding protein [Synechococcus sp. SB0668_bin_15]MXZ83603.1 metal ABC transporter substrate-binding protein [Synechococcus sp. SB0666_bin_14]MYA90584.1 metal ABC transporter substrate-binding protein [Synechococcus sp. SB0663_bin_10]MYC48689.1 metal ABC transporter substrate-binding protein [Synechococcus sp. SB0662_bin_14]MYG46729.1 metal ABC transporter substrate-binding protein [Synechococcus sp. SB0675_bin_6]MYJ60574.1 metal ABC transporter substrate-bind
MVAVTLVGLMGCTAGRPVRQQDTSRPKVLASFTILADMAQAVAGDHLEVTSLVKLGAEVHSYEPTPSDLRQAAGAVLIVDNGLNMESWRERFYVNLPDHIPRVTLTQGIEPLSIDDVAVAGRPNPHAWMSPRLAMVYVENLRQAFTKIAPEHGEDFAASAAAYNRKLLQLDKELRQTVARLPKERRLLVTCEGAFSYLARDYGLDEAYLWPVNGDSEVTAQRLAGVVRLVEERQLPAVFCESTVNSAAQEEVAATTGARLAGVLYVDSLSGPQGPAPTLLELQRHNIRTLMDGLLQDPR